MCSFFALVCSKTPEHISGSSRKAVEQTVLEGWRTPITAALL